MSGFNFFSSISVKFDCKGLRISIIEKIFSVAQIIIQPAKYQVIITMYMKEFAN